MLRFTIFSVCSLLTVFANEKLANASPFPASSTSALTSPAEGLFFSSKGFHLGTEGTDWILHQDHSLNRGDDGTSWRFRSSASSSATVNLKTDFLKADLTLEAYAKRWMRDYNQLGLEVLGTRAFTEKAGNRGLVIDLLQPKKKLQLRQAVFLKNKNVVILTCSDEQGKVQKLIEDCNRLIKNFSWVETSGAPAKR